MLEMIDFGFCCSLRGRRVVIAAWKKNHSSGMKNRGSPRIQMDTMSDEMNAASNTVHSN